MLLRIENARNQIKLIGNRIAFANHDNAHEFILVTVATVSKHGNWGFCYELKLSL